MNLSQLPSLLKETASEWSKDKISMWSAALAYYTIFSLSPLLLVVIGIAGFVFGADVVQTSIYNQLNGLIGDAGALLIENMVRNASKPSQGILATVIGTVTLLLGASGVFGQLEAALNHIFKVAPKPGAGFLRTIMNRVLNFSMVLVIAFLLLVSLVLSAGLQALQQFLSHLLPIPGIFLSVINFGVSLAVITILFALLYKLLPDVKLTWRDVFIGGAFTSLLFTIGKTLIGIYLGRSSLSSTYGAAASMVIILLWVYYTAQIVFFGAEFTKMYVLRTEKGLKPDRFAEITVPALEKKKEKGKKKDDGTLLDAAVVGYVKQRTKK